MLWEVTDCGAHQMLEGLCRCEYQTTAQGSLCMGLCCTLESFPEYFSLVKLVSSSLTSMGSNDFGIIQSETGKQTVPAQHSA